VTLKLSRQPRTEGILTKTPRDSNVEEQQAAIAQLKATAAQQQKQIEALTATAMLLNDFLKEPRTVAEQQNTIAELKMTVAQQQKQIEALTATVQKVSDQLELTKAAPQLVANP